MRSRVPESRLAGWYAKVLARTRLRLVEAVDPGDPSDWFVNEPLTYRTCVAEVGHPIYPITTCRTKYPDGNTSSAVEAAPAGIWTPSTKGQTISASTGRFNALTVPRWPLIPRGWRWCRSA